LAQADIAAYIDASTILHVVTAILAGSVLSSSKRPTGKEGTVSTKSWELHPESLKTNGCFQSKPGGWTAWTEYRPLLLYIAEEVVGPTYVGLRPVVMSYWVFSYAEVRQCLGKQFAITSPGGRDGNP